MKDYKLVRILEAASHSLKIQGGAGHALASVPIAFCRRNECRSRNLRQGNRLAYERSATRFGDATKIGTFVEIQKGGKIGDRC